MDAIVAEAERRGFSRQEAESLLNMGGILCGRVLRDYIERCVREDAARADPENPRAPAGLARRLLALSALPAPPHVGYQELAIPGVEEPLRMQLAIVPADYEIELRLPPDPRLIREVLGAVDRLVSAALAFHAGLVRQEDAAAQAGQSPISPLAGASSPTLALRQLEIEVHRRHLFFPGASERVGVLCFFVDKDGRPFAK